MLCIRKRIFVNKKNPDGNQDFGRPQKRPLICSAEYLSYGPQTPAVLTDAHFGERINNMKPSTKLVPIASFPTMIMPFVLESLFHANYDYHPALNDIHCISTELSPSIKTNMLFIVVFLLIQIMFVKFLPLVEFKHFLHHHHMVCLFKSKSQDHENGASFLSRR
jgi:hypothetical protein